MSVRSPYAFRRIAVAVCTGPCGGIVRGIVFGNLVTVLDIVLVRNLQKITDFPIIMLVIALRRFPNACNRNGSHDEQHGEHKCKDAFLHSLFPPFNSVFISTSIV